jgi:SOS-response transcriptional repressor LexA
MEPTIRDGDYIVLRANPAGTRQRKIVLAQYRGPADPETGGSFTIKRYASEKKRAEDGGWLHTKVTLSPTNGEYQPIVLTGADAEHVTIVAEFVTVLRGT